MVECGGSTVGWVSAGNLMLKQEQQVSLNGFSCGGSTVRWCLRGPSCSSRIARYGSSPVVVCSGIAVFGAAAVPYTAMGLPVALPHVQLQGQSRQQRIPPGISSVHSANMLHCWHMHRSSSPNYCMLPAVSPAAELPSKPACVPACRIKLLCGGCCI